MKIKIVLLLFVTSFLFSFSLYKKNKLSIPNYFPKIPENINLKSITSSKILLGRVLFYDPILSLDSSVSCASCHSSYSAFAHTDHKLSHGIHDSIGFRNAPPIFNLLWKKTFMWDGAIPHLHMQALAPIENKIEMEENIDHVLYKLQKSSLYKSLFYKAFRDSTISTSNLLDAIQSFEYSILSYNSKYDSVKKNLTVFNEQEKKGYVIFQKNCNKCHTEPLFTNYTFTNNGLFPNKENPDLGRYRITKNEKDSFVFSIPSLRNLSYTFPYMHDGRFQNLYTVINFYNGKKHISSSLDTSLQTSINLSDHDKIDLLVFLLTLNDESFIKNSAYQYPKNIFLKK